MRKYLFVILYTSYFILFLSTGKVSAMWDCDTNFQIDPSTTAPRCVENDTGTFNSLRECLQGSNNPDPTPLPASNNCIEDPRYVMRNFAALNFWSVGKVLSLAVPLTVTLGAGVCLVFLLFGAYRYITSAGEQKQITDATSTMTYAVIGLIVVVVAYAVVRTILMVTQVNTFGF